MGCVPGPAAAPSNAEHVDKRATNKLRPLAQLDVLPHARGPGCTYGATPPTVCNHYTREKPQFFTGFNSDCGSTCHCSHAKIPLALHPCESKPVNAIQPSRTTSHHRTSPNQAPSSLLPPRIRKKRQNGHDLREIDSRAAHNTPTRHFCMAMGFYKVPSSNSFHFADDDKLPP